MAFRLARPYLASNILRTIGSRSFSNIKTQYVAKAIAIGGRAGGTVELADGTFKAKTEVPTAPSKSPADRNPEELFALGYGACFLGAMGAVYRVLFPKNPTFPRTARVDTAVHLGTPADDTPGWLLAVKLEIPYKSLEGSNLSVEEAKELIKQAHQMCPYSKATRGNIEVEVDLLE